jgi:UPF0716 protein FxsA
MNVLGRLALLFVIVPIIELVLLIEVGKIVGLLPTLGIVLLTGMTGAWLARAEGLRVLFRFQKELASGQLPGQSILDGISVLVGGAFLITPGVLTDFVGLSLLFPPTRRWVQRRVRARLEKHVKAGAIQVVTMGSWGGVRTDPTAAPEPGVGGLDPSKGIVIEPEDGEFGGG